MSDWLRTAKAGAVRVARGSASVTGTLDIDTGLNTVDSMTATVRGADSANASEVTNSAVNSAGFRKLMVWKNSAAGNTTPVASSTPTIIDWIAVGS